MVREIDDGAVREEVYGPHKPYSLLQMDRFTIFSERGTCLYRGYPIAMREVDFENQHIEQGAVTTRAEYVGRTPYEAIHELRLLNLGPLPSIDGLSGSPVFQVHNEEGTKYSREAFAGMLIRGSIESGRIFLIEHRRIAPLEPVSWRASIAAFANQMDVHPGLVVGQLQHHGAIPYSFHRDLLEKVRPLVVATTPIDDYCGKT